MIGILNCAHIEDVSGKQVRLQICANRVKRAALEAAEVLADQGLFH